MSKIKLYDNDNTVEENDNLIGTDSNGLTTKNYSLSAISSYISSQTLSHPVILTDIVSATSDAEAETAGVAVGGIYENNGQLYIRKV